MSSLMTPSDYLTPGSKKSTQERINVLSKKFFTGSESNLPEKVRVEAFLADLLNLTQSGSASRGVVIEAGTFKSLSPEIKKQIEDNLDNLVQAAKVELAL